MFLGVEVLQQLDGNIWFHVDLLPRSNVMGRLMQPMVNYMSVESGRNAAVTWRNSDDVSRCQLCDMEFSFFNRKHHCRLCGDVFCAACSNNKISINGTLQRVQHISYSISCTNVDGCSSWFRFVCDVILFLSQSLCQWFVPFKNSERSISILGGEREKPSDPI
jgi:hypothetical protein